MEEWIVHSLTSTSDISTRRDARFFEQVATTRAIASIEQFFENTNPQAGIRSILMNTGSTVSRSETKSGIDLNFFNFHLRFTKKTPKLITMLSNERGISLSIQTKDINTLNHILGKFKEVISDNSHYNLRDYVSIDSNNQTKINMMLGIKDTAKVLEILNEISVFSAEMNAAITNWHSSKEKFLYSAASNLSSNLHTMQQQGISEKRLQVKLK